MGQTAVGSESLVQELRRPFTADAIKFKIQTGPQQRQGGKFSQAMLVSYIDARLAGERLNHVLGLDWSDSYEPVQGGMKCTIRIGDTVRSDVGYSRGTGTDMDLKALYSDAFKRAAVKFGVGVSLYALPRLYLPAEDLTHRGEKWFLPDKVLPKLRVRYETWLAAEGVRAFGEPLDHGDVPDSQGDTEAEPEQIALDVDVLAQPRAKALFMAAALASKAEVDVTDLRVSVEDCSTRDELKAIFTKMGKDLKAAGGDPVLVAQRFEEAHA